MLTLTLREGDYLLLGDDICVHFDHKVGYGTVALTIEAPKDVPVLRGKLYEKNLEERAAAGDEEARKLAAKLKKERDMIGQRYQQQGKPRALRAKPEGGPQRAVH